VSVMKVSFGHHLAVGGKAATRIVLTQRRLLPILRFHLTFAAVCD